MSTCLIRLSLSAGVRRGPPCTIARKSFMSGVFKFPLLVVLSYPPLASKLSCYYFPVHLSLIVFKMDCLDNDCTCLELVPVPTHSIGGCAAADARISALGQFIETQSRDKLPEEVKYAFFEFCNNQGDGWDPVKLIHYCLAHDSDKNVALALVLACEFVVKNHQDLAARLCETLAEGVMTFRFKYVHPNVHSRLYQLIGYQAPPYSQQNRGVATKAPPRYVEFLERDPKPQSQAFSQFPGRESKPQPQSKAFSQGRTVYQPNAPKPMTKAQQYDLQYDMGQEYPRVAAKARPVYTPQSGGCESGGGRGSGTEVVLRGSGLQMERRSNHDNTGELQRIAQQVLGPFMDQVFQAVKIQGSRLDAVEDNAAMNEAKIASLRTELQQTRADNACEFAKSRAESAAQSAAQHKQLMESLGRNPSVTPVPASSSFTQPPQRPLGGAGFPSGGGPSVFPTRGPSGGGSSAFPAKGGGAGAGFPSGGGAGAGFNDHANMCHMHTLMNQGLSTFIGNKGPLVESTRVANNYDNGGAEHASLIALTAKHTKAQGSSVFSRSLYAQIRVVFPAFDPETFLPPNAKEFSGMYDTKKRKADEIPDDDASDDGSGSGGGHFGTPLPDPRNVNFGAVPAAAGGGPPVDDAARAAIEVLKALSDKPFAPSTAAGDASA